MINPFLKWPGGKRWLITSGQFPEIGSFNRYIEPFLGGAAIFFHFKPKQAILTDINKDLIKTYQAIADDYQSVESILKHHQAKHCKEYYYEIRQSCPIDKISDAARFIYLNRTCWNGLYRVNKKGQFNVPIGTRNSVIRDSDNFKAISDLLKSAIINVSDFEDTVDLSIEGDLLFIDPPYTVKHNHNNFIKYNENIFSWKDQKRLRDCLLRAKNRGVKIIITNAYHECIKDIYHHIGDISNVVRTSLLASDVSSRKTVSEALITVNINYYN
jgi:DNA adenine methylase